MTTLSVQEQRALAEFARRVRQLFGARLDSVTLFGSRARAEGRDDSDLDVLVRVARVTRLERRSVQDVAFDVGFEYGLIFSPSVADQQKWRFDLPLARIIEQEGVPL